MSASSLLKGEVEIYGVEVTTPNRIDSEIEKAREDVELYKQKISMLVSATPKDIFPSDSEGTTMEKLGWELDSLFEAYDEAFSRLTKLYVIQLNSDTLVDPYAQDNSEND